MVLCLPNRPGMLKFGVPAAKHPSAEERCARFAAALLCGQVLPAVSQFAEGLNVRSSTLASREARALVRVSDLIQALLSQQVDSRAALAAAWQHDGELSRLCAHCIG
jgi:hypothetical protein